MNSKFFREWDGTLTRELVLEPGKFGLGKIPARLKPDQVANSICGFCSTGCSLKIHLKHGEAIALTPTPDYPVNLGMACPKGWEALTPLSSPDRGTVPLLRAQDGSMQAVDWDTSMRKFVEGFKSVQSRHGKEAVAWIGTGQIMCEELAMLGALGKFGMGMLHGDGNTRQCMATAVTAYKQSFGFDAPPYTYADFEESDVLLFIGSNLCIAHPILWQRVCRNPHKPEIVVIDPRLTETAQAATQHYAIQPKSDLIFFYGIANILFSKGWIDSSFLERHTSGFEEFREFVRQFTPEIVARTSGISEARLQDLAETIHRGKRVSFWWTMGVNQSHEGVRTAQAIINLALMTGNIGRPGTGANSITGQCNAMGSRLFSNTTNLLGGHDFTNPNHRLKVAEILGIETDRIPARNSWAYDEILEGIRQDKIKGLWIIATNTAHSWIHQNDARELLEKLEFLVVQDMYHTTETVEFADLYLPAAGWGEKEGTFINSERRIGHCKKVSKAPGEALSDFNIFRLVAEYWGCGKMFIEWTSPEAVFQRLKELTFGQPCDISGIRDYQMLDEEGGVQWPFTTRAVPPKKERRLFEDGWFFHPDGRARFFFELPKVLPEATDAEYPWILLTGRGTSAQWHTQTRTGKSKILQKLYPASVYAEINPDDARKLDIKPNEKIEVVSRRGKISVAAFLVATVQPGQIFIPMHYDVVNQLTYPAFDSYSRQPSYKSCAVNLRKVSKSNRNQSHD